MLDKYHYKAKLRLESYTTGLTAVGVGAFAELLYSTHKISFFHGIVDIAVILCAWRIILTCIDKRAALLHEEQIKEATK